MKNKILSFVCVLIISVFVFAPVTRAASDTFQFTVDVNERYTDISYVDENGKIITEDEAEKQNDANLNTYVAVLSVLLVIAVIVLIVSIHKAKRKSSEEIEKLLKEDAEKEKASAGKTNTTAENEKETALNDETQKGTSKVQQSSVVKKRMHGIKNADVKKEVSAGVAENNTELTDEMEAEDKSGFNDD